MFLLYNYIGKKLMKKLLTLLIFFITQSISANEYVVTLADKHYNKSISVETIIKYDEEGYNQLGYDINGFDKKHINKNTGTKYDDEGFDYLGLGVKIVYYTRANTEASHCQGCSRARYSIKWKGSTIASNYSFSVIREGLLLTKGPTRDCNGGQYSRCRSGINAQRIKPTE
jgi:hypothetical protein